LRTNDNCS